MSGITQYQTQVTEIQNKWKNYAETLPEEHREVCRNAVNAIAGDLLYNISILYDANYGDEALQKTLSQWTHKFEFVADFICRSKETYVEERGSLRKAMLGVDAALQNTSLNSTSLTKVSLNGPSFSQRALAVAEETKPTYQFPSDQDLGTCLRSRLKSYGGLPFLEQRGVIEAAAAVFGGQEDLSIEDIEGNFRLLQGGGRFVVDRNPESMLLTKTLENCATKKTE